MIRTGLVGTIIVVAAASAVARHQPIQGGVRDGSAIGVYKEFMALPADQRRARFAAMTPQNKASLKRSHMEGWIQANKGRLTASEIAVFEAMVAYVTPEVYRRQVEGAVDKREQELRAKMRCRVSPEDVRAATSLFAASATSGSQNATWSYVSQAKCWVSWFLEGVIDYIPR